MKNTERYQEYINLCAEYKEHKSREMLHRIIKLKKALLMTGCYSPSHEQIRLRSFVADNIKDVKCYLAPEKHPSFNAMAFVALLKENNVPITASALQRLVKTVEASAARHKKDKNNWKRKNSRRPLPIKRAAEALIREDDDISQDDIDVEIKNIFMQNIAAAANQ